MVKEYYDEEKIKIAFSNVKKDILELKREIKEIKLILLKKEDKINDKNDDSTGNKGVVVMPLYRRYDAVIPEKEYKSKINVKNLEILDQNIKKFITSLTDKEFLIFLAIYQLEEELERPVTYIDLALKLKISTFSLRNRISGLLLKKAPVIKERLYNSKSIFSIEKEFRDLKIGDKLLNFRKSFDEQTRISDLFGD